MKDFLTVSEFATLAGVTRQSIYNQLSKKLKSYLQVVDGKTLIKSVALEEIYKVTDKVTDKQTVNSDNDIVKQLTAEVEYLREQNRQLLEMVAVDKKIKLLEMQQDRLPVVVDLEPEATAKKKKRKKKKK